MKKRILIAEDNLVNYERMKSILGADKFDIVWTQTGRETFERLRDENFDIAILDLRLMDKMSGMDVIKMIRPLKPKLPIMAFTAYYGGWVNEECIHLGADECITSPYLDGNFKARVEMLLRHCNGVNGESGMEYGGIHLDLLRRTITCCEQTFDVTPIEFSLMEILLGARGGIVSSERLEKDVWGNIDADSGRLYSRISELNRKFKRVYNREEKVISNERNIGYAIKI